MRQKSALIAVYIVLVALAIACGSTGVDEEMTPISSAEITEEPNGPIFTEDIKIPRESPPEWGKPIISDPDLENGSDISIRTSFSLLPPKTLSASSGYKYSVEEYWSNKTQDPEDRLLSEQISEDVWILTEQGVREFLLYTGYLRRLSGVFLSVGKAPLCLGDLTPINSHGVVLDILIFETSTGAQQFLEIVITPSIKSKDGSSWDENFAYLSRSEAVDCIIPAPDPTPCCRRMALNFTLSREVAWVADGPFLIRLGEQWFGESDPDPNQNAFSYAQEQLRLLSKEFPEYFE